MSSRDYTTRCNHCTTIQIFRYTIHDVYLYQARIQSLCLGTIWGKKEWTLIDTLLALIIEVHNRGITYEEFHEYPVEMYDA